MSAERLDKWPTLVTVPIRQFSSEYSGRQIKRTTGNIVHWRTLWNPFGARIAMIPTRIALIVRTNTLSSSFISYAKYEMESHYYSSVNPFSCILIPGLPTIRSNVDYPSLS